MHKPSLASHRCFFLALVMMLRLAPYPCLSEAAQQAFAIPCASAPLYIHNFSDGTFPWNVSYDCNPPIDIRIAFSDDSIATVPAANRRFTLTATQSFNKITVVTDNVTLPPPNGLQFDLIVLAQAPQSQVALSADSGPSPMGVIPSFVYFAAASQSTFDRISIQLGSDLLLAGVTRPQCYVYIEQAPYASVQLMFASDVVVQNTTLLSFARINDRNGYAARWGDGAAEVTVASGASVAISNLGRFNVLYTSIQSYFDLVERGNSLGLWCFSFLLLNSAEPWRGLRVVLLGSVSLRGGPILCDNQWQPLVIVHFHDTRYRRAGVHQFCDWQCDFVPDGQGKYHAIHFCSIQSHCTLTGGGCP